MLIRVGALTVTALLLALLLWRTTDNDDAHTDQGIPVVVVEMPVTPRSDTPSPVVTAGTPSLSEDAVIRTVSGVVEVGVDGSWSPASVGQRVAKDESVRAGRSSTAELSVGAGVVVRLSPRTELSIREVSEAMAKVQLLEGHITATVDEQGKRTLQVRAAQGDAVAESGGGTFGVLADRGGQLAVATTTGQVRLASAGVAVDVPAGQGAQASAASAPSAPRAIDPTLFVRMQGTPKSRTNQKETDVRGTTVAGARVRIGDQQVHADQEGNFTLRVPLRDGKNDLKLEVDDASGRVKQQNLPTVVVDRQKPTIDTQVQWGNPKHP
jgi:hypothetical protein